MNIFFSKVAFARQLKFGFILIIIASGAITACNSDDVGGNLYTFTDQMMGEYLKSNPAEFSEFSTLLDTTGVVGLLDAYGKYTCFAPTNEAMRKFYLSKGKKSLADFTLDSLKIIAYDHIINGSVIMYSKFVDGRLPELSMSDRYISINFSDTGAVFVNKTSEILKKDMVVHNGVIHEINEVLNPTRFGIVDAISADSTFTLFYNALVKTGLADSLLKDRDETYNAALYQDLVTVPLDAAQWYYQEVPSARKYGYTLLMESDDTYKANGITNFQSLKDYAASVYNLVYPEDANITDITNRHNSLNRFIAYHIINKQLSYSKFIDAYDTDHMIKNRDMYEYLEPMCPNTLIEIKKERLTSRTNLINYLPETGKVIQIVKANSDKDATNGVYHEIDGILAYSKDVDNELSSKRLRFDAASFFPELTNNNMRGRGTTLPNLQFRLPRGYIDRISSSEQTVVSYLTPYYKYQDYEGDEIFLGATTGKLFDFSIVTPPVPAGTYEVRFGYLTNDKRGVTQLYFDNVPAGVPLNLNTRATDPSIGYETPHSVPADYDGYENDKMMRNRGYMKGPACFKVPTEGWSYGENARFSNQLLRKIMGTYTFTTAGNHVLTAKGLSGGEFMFDYLEFVPTSALENEDIY
ncbi:MAG: fasciclin domain-containing protein [Paludibacter sp.]